MWPILLSLPTLVSGGLDRLSTWDVVVKTCNETSSGTDASVFLKVYYIHANAHEIFQLDHPTRNDFERGARDHFKIFLNSSDITHIGLFWWPTLSLSQSWCVDWLTIMNSESEECFVAVFSKWILHYSDPPTYPSSFAKTRFAHCVSPV